MVNIVIARRLLLISMCLSLASCSTERSIGIYLPIFNEGYIDSLKVVLNADIDSKLEIPPKAIQEYNAGVNLYNRQIEKPSYEILARSEKHFLNAITICSNFAEAYVGLGFVQIYQQKNMQAAKTFRKAIQLEPSNALAHFGLAEMTK